MTNEQAFKLYLAIKLHFTTKYDVFENQGRFKNMSKLMERADFNLIYPLTKMVNEDREFVQLCVANFLYGNEKFLYDHAYAEDNFKHWQKVKQSITFCLTRDLGYIDLQLMKRNCTLDVYVKQHILSDLLSKRVEYETLVVLERHTPIIDKMAGFDADKYKVRLHKANRFVTNGVLAEMHRSQIDNFLSNNN